METIDIMEIQQNELMKLMGTKKDESPFVDGPLKHICKENKLYHFTSFLTKSFLEKVNKYG